jgi:hypothetical protein
MMPLCRAGTELLSLGCQVSIVKAVDTSRMSLTAGIIAVVHDNAAQMPLQQPLSRPDVSTIWP